MKCKSNLQDLISTLTPVYFIGFLFRISNPLKQFTHIGRTTHNSLIYFGRFEHQVR